MRRIRHVVRIGTFVVLNRSEECSVVSSYTHYSLCWIANLVVELLVCVPLAKAVVELYFVGSYLG